MSTIGQRINALRTARGATLSHLAAEVGVSKSYIHAIENSPDAKPSAEIAYDLARALGTTVGYLIGREDAAPTQAERDTVIRIRLSESEDAALTREAEAQQRPKARIIRALIRAAFIE